MREIKDKGRKISKRRSERGFWGNFYIVLLQALAWIGAAIACYCAISLLFDTPYEYYMKHSAHRLNSEYEALQNRLDSLDMVISNIEERETSIFNIIFESTPYSLDVDEQNEAMERREKLLSMKDQDLIATLQHRTSTLDMGVGKLVVSTQNMISNIKEKGRESSKIPSIQPVSNRQLTLLTASFGWRINPFYRTLHQHLGVDYTIPEGSRVYATADGVIKEFSTSSSVSGKSITINHGNGYETYYAHLKLIDIPRSRRVKRGDVIGLSGNTGLSVAPHLHYEVRYNGESIDPINYFFMELNPSQSRRMERIAEAGMQSFD